MNLRDLQYVVAVADHGHFGRAAAACNVSQPTLSGQILKLEGELGIELFERSGRVVRVSSRASPIIEHARRALEAAAEMAIAARGARDPLVGALKLGVIPTVAPYLLPYALPPAIRDLPLAPIKVVEDLTDRLLSMLLDGKLDAAVIATDPANDKFASLALYEEPFLLAVPREHPLARRKAVAPLDIDPDTLLLLADGHCLRDQTLELCARQAVNRAARSEFSAASLETLLHLTAAGYGVTLAPRLAVENRRAAGGALVALPFKGKGIGRRIDLLFRRDTARRAAIDRLAASIRGAAPNTVRKSEVLG
ncbi:MAG TPA: LysR substrate-binding domain-containing protein [Roseiarcus sp.]|jgi:LysR family hydrogen peroxide-inducible transcriptional activator